MNYQIVAWVYCITDGRYTKIGKANNVEKRLNQLQTASPKQLTVTQTFPFLSEKDAFDFERMLHKTFEHFKVNNEWYDLQTVNMHPDVPTIMNSIPESLQMWLEDAGQIENRPTNDVFLEYEAFCKRNSLDVVPHGEFSKQVKKYYGFTIKDKKIQGKKYRIFMKEGEN